MSQTFAFLSFTLTKPTLHILNSVEVQPRDEEDHNEVEGDEAPENSLAEQC